MVVVVAVVAVAMVVMVVMVVYPAGRENEAKIAAEKGFGFLLF